MKSRILPVFALTSALAACGTDPTQHPKLDAALVPLKQDAQVVVIYVTRDAAPPNCTCFCTGICSCVCDGIPAATADTDAGQPASDVHPNGPEALAASPDQGVERNDGNFARDADLPDKNADGPASADIADAAYARDASLEPIADSAPGAGSDLGPDLPPPDTAPDLPPALTATCPAYVSAGGINAGTPNGSPLAPWETIQGAIDNIAKCDTIIVKRGTYKENISCSSYRFYGTLRSEEGPSATIIDASGSANKSPGIELDECSPLTIEGFTIANAAGVGINVYSVPETVIVQHNIFLHNNEGITVVYGPGDGSPVIIRNNIIIGNPNATTGAYAGTGIGHHQSGGLRLVENNLIIGNPGTSDTSAGVFIDNWATGYAQNNIIAYDRTGIHRYYDYNTMTFQYNCLFGNAADYVGATAGTGDVHADPKFATPWNGDANAATDFHLAANSPCRNAGNPDPAYNNPDGTRNDIGPYGGPYGNW